MLQGHGRYEYSPITRRPPFEWVDGKRLAVYVAINLEHFAFGEGLGAELAPGGPHPDVLNYAWRDYGNRVGVWRMIELLDDLELPATVLANSEMYEYAPEVLEAFSARGDEIVGHGRSNTERQGTLIEADEAALIREATESIARVEGKAPAGWLGPWISQSLLTPDLLKEAGYRYQLDWCHDDQPTWFTTRSGPLLSVPYPQEINDIPMIVARKMDAAPFCDMIIDNYDEMREQARHQPLVCGIALHPYIMGQPYRLRHLRRALKHLTEHAEGTWFTTAGAIADRFVAQIPPG
ncbi:MAG: polysaccharide deacetylase [Mycobacterium sp.]|nr:polysaccharide deacetylase [Mycobacterium sp.]